MHYILKAEEMKLYDRLTINKGLPVMVLMERAALGVADAVMEWMKPDSKVLIAAGIGNNGGDGLAAGRILAMRGAEVTFCLIGSENNISVETSQQLKILENYGFSIQSKIEIAEYDIIIDALLGIGLNREIAGEYKEAVETINRLRRGGSKVCSADIPSGIQSDNGKVMGFAVKADKTVAFAYAKAGHYFFPGKEYTGELLIIDIGIKAEEKEARPSFFTYKEPVTQLVPIRPPDGNKGTFGKVLLIAGSPDMCGACILCGKSIFRTGAGMVKIITHLSNREILQQTLPEAMLYTFEDLPDEAEIIKALSWADAAVMGPGMGQSQAAYQLVSMVLSHVQIPIVMDADALNLTAAESKLKECLQTGTGKPVIMTPHPGELIRLLNCDMEAYEENREGLLKELTQSFGCIAAGKDAATLVTAFGEEQAYLNVTGNDGMATAGSGDVLAGMIGGLLAQGMDAFTGTCTGVYLHGLAGDRAAQSKSRYGVMASDIIQEIGHVMSVSQSTGKEEA